VDVTRSVVAVMPVMLRSVYIGLFIVHARASCNALNQLLYQVVSDGARSPGPLLSTPEEKFFNLVDIVLRECH